MSKDKEQSASSGGGNNDFTARQMLQLAEDTIPKFSGQDKSYTAARWTQDIDDHAEIFEWTTLQCLVIARRSLTGTAALWLKSERLFKSWADLKAALLKEFPDTIDQKAVHEMMSSRRKKPSESYLDYMLVMKELGKRGKLPDYVAIKYIVDGITDAEMNKISLYSATTYSDLKEKLKIYELVKSKTKSQSQSPAPAYHRELRCYNCGEKNHRSLQCPRKKDGLKCFKCGEFGHIASVCNKYGGNGGGAFHRRESYERDRFGQDRQRSDNIGASSRAHARPADDRRRYQHTDGTAEKRAMFGEVDCGEVGCPASGSNMAVDIDIDSRCHNIANVNKQCDGFSTKPNIDVLLQNEISVNALVDTGSEVNLIEERVYNKLDIECIKEDFSLLGLGHFKVKSLGRFVVPITIDGKSTDIVFHIIPNGNMPYSVIIGQEFLTGYTVVFNGRSIHLLDKGESWLNKIDIIEASCNFVVGNECSVAVQEEVIRCIEEYQPVKTKEAPIELRIVLKDDIPVAQRPRRLSLKEQQIVEDQVTEWLDNKIIREQSHKSYRPLTVLTFRWNYAVHGLQPAGYHLVNLLLHALVSLLYYRVCAMFLPEFASFVAAILFAVHPIHTEAVTGVVGRAEMLSSLFFLCALLCYARAASRRRNTDWRYVAACTACVGIAMLCKEQGITVTGVCVVYELFVAQKRRSSGGGSRWSWLDAWGKGSGWGCACGEAARRVATVCCATLALLAARLHVMGAQLPVFTRFDNPAGAAPPPARHLTFAYLPALNAWLLTLPEALCCDWTMGTVALLRSWRDPRNLATLALATTLIAAAIHALKTRSSALSMGLALLVLPFLPASNLFFPVGFVVAERVLYMPSMGWCLLVAHGWRLLAKKRAKLAAAMLIFLILAFSAKSYVRNWDWKNEYSIFASGLKVNRNNAKLYNNVGHALEAQGKYAEALDFFNTAVNVQPDDVGAHINVGRTYNHLGRYQEAEDAYIKAKSLLPKAKPGESYQARIAPNHLNVFLNLANLISKNATRLEEADMLYRQAISMRADYTQAYINRGDILIKLNRTKEAQEVYERALLYDSGNPDIYYNLGVVLLEQGKASQALAYLDKALELEPEHEQALMNSAIILQELGAEDLRHLARQRLLKLLDKDPTNERVHFNLGMVCMDEGDAECAERWFRAAVHLKPDFRSALFNLALLLADRRRPLEAAPFLKQLVRHHPDHAKALVLLGDIYINTVKDLDAAESCYRRILERYPDNVQALHNLCVVAVERGKLAIAEECLTRAVKLAPKEQYIQKHLAVVRARRVSATATTKPSPAAAVTATTEVRARWNYIPQQPPDPHETDVS